MSVLGMKQSDIALPSEEKKPCTHTLTVCGDPTGKCNVMDPDDCPHVPICANCGEKVIRDERLNSKRR